MKEDGSRSAGQPEEIAACQGELQKGGGCDGIEEMLEDLRRQ